MRRIIQRKAAPATAKASRKPSCLPTRSQSIRISASTPQIAMSSTLA